MDTECILKFLLDIMENLLEIIKNISKIIKTAEELPTQSEENDKSIQNVLEEIKNNDSNDFHDEEFIYFILVRLY
jgi:hypothetical protein